MSIELIHGDCREQKIESNIDLIITSPPYNCGKNYNSVTDNLLYDEYWRFTVEWLGKAYNALKTGGRLAVNLPWWMMKKPRKDVPSKFKQIAEIMGFLFIDKIIWVKGNEKNQNVSGGWGGGGCGWGTYMSPSGPTIRCASEPILIFAKDSRGRKRISGKGNGDCLKNDITKNEFLSWTIDIWFINGSKDKEHPATFPQEIPYRIIKLYTYPNEIVYDPFMGVGTTGKVCVELGRNFIGVEKDSIFFNIAKNRITSTCSGFADKAPQTTDV